MSIILPEERKAYLNRYPCVLVGGRKVGKTTIANNFSNMKKIASWEYQRIQLWDAVDSKGTISTLAWEAQVYMLAFSLVDRNSLTELSKWHELIQANSKYKELYLFVVGTKSDLRDKFSEKYVPYSVWVDPELNTGIEYFKQLPYELILHILSFLDSGSLWSVSNTCTLLQKCYKDPQLWKEREKGDLPVAYEEGAKFARSIGAKYIEITNVPPHTNFAALFQLLPSKTDNASCTVS